MSKYSYYSQKGYNKLVAELEHMKSTERPSISRQIAEARDKGDLSENAEYDAAKEAQGLLEMKISQLEERVLNARVLDESQMDVDKVYVLSKVQFKNLKLNKTLEYTLVAESEASLAESKISVDSPIGQALLGSRIGDVVEAKVPSGTMALEILTISR